jgi:hypothetical protein
VNDRVRAWSRRGFFDPAPVLVALRLVEIELAQSDTPDLVRRLRTNWLKTDREGRGALLFAYGMSVATGAPVFVSPGESEDCDFITRFNVNDSAHFSCVQLKELVPEDRNQTQTFEGLIAQLQRLPPSDAVLAIRMNRREQIPLAELAAARVPFAELWYFWASSADTGSWSLYGDALTNPQLYTFEYPK